MTIGIIQRPETKKNGAALRSLSESRFERKFVLAEILPTLVLTYF
jgi:hypothetical protein